MGALFRITGLALLVTGLYLCIQVPGVVAVVTGRWLSVALKPRRSSACPQIPQPLPRCAIGSSVLYVVATITS